MNPPTIPVVAGYVLQGIVAKQALAIDRSRPAHRPFALVAVYAAIVDPIRWPITQQRLVAGHGHPYEGLILAGWHLDRALFLGWPVALAGASWTVFAGRAAWPHLLGALGLWVALGAAIYPAGNSRGFLALAHGLAILAAYIPLARRLWDRRWPSETERLLGIYIAAEMVAWPLLYTVDDRAMGSKLSWGVYLTALAVAIGMQYLWARNIQENRA